MNVDAVPLDIPDLNRMEQPAFIAAVCNHLGVRLCGVPSNGSCFFDSIYALLPTVGKGTVRSGDLRECIVNYFRQCCAGNHGDIGVRIVIDMEAALHSKIISSVPQTRQHNKKPKNMEDYLDAVSKRSVWVEGFHWPRAVHMTIRAMKKKGKGGKLKGKCCCCCCCAVYTHAAPCS